MTPPPTDGELRAFVGPRADYYVRAWAPLLEGKSDARFNLAAFFLGAFWLGYRKMFRPVLILFGILLAESILEDVVFLVILKWKETPRVMTTLVIFAVAGIVGANGNEWYFSRAKWVIDSVRALQLPEEQHLSELSRRGGTNLLASLGWFALWFVVSVVIYGGFAMVLGLDGE